MKNPFELQDINLKELSHEESIEITGGDKFMHDLGYAVGYVAGWLWDQTAVYRAMGGMAVR